MMNMLLFFYYKVKLIYFNQNFIRINYIMFIYGINIFLLMKLILNKNNNKIIDENELCII